MYISAVNNRNYRGGDFLILAPGLNFLHHMTDICLFFFMFFCPTVSNKPGVCVKVLSLKPRPCQLEEELAQLADAALPAELGVRRIAVGKLQCFCHQF